MWACHSRSFQVTVKTGVFALLFARYVAGAGTVVAPADPEGKVGAARSLRRLGARGLRAGRGGARARGGVDAELHVRRIRMRLACLEVWALLAVPLACVYALDPKKCGWLPERREVEEEPCTGVNPCCGFAEFLESEEMDGTETYYDEDDQDYKGGGPMFDYVERNCKVQYCQFGPARTVAHI